ncbi:MAG: DnaD domain protein [Pygmaiobacter massiliensis]|nr:DnaD domain protein [Pygmaiobacter massiliensis]
MGYRITKQYGDTVAVPRLVTERLSAAGGDEVKVALEMLASGCTDPGVLAKNLGLSQQIIERAQAFWAGAGLLKPDGELCAAACVQQKRPPRLTAHQVVAYSQQDENVSMLISESQAILGKPLSPSESAALVTLYLQDHMPIDMILPVMAHYAARGKREVRYLEKVLLSWQEQGIKDGLAAEQQLSLLEQREQQQSRVAQLLGVAHNSFTAGECTLIARWYEEYGYDESMIEAALLRAGSKRTVRYLSGILKKWHAAGYRTVRELPAEGANLQPTGRRYGATPLPPRSSRQKVNGILLPQEKEEAGV